MQSIFFGVATLLIWVALTIMSYILAHIPILGWLMMALLWMAFWLGWLVLVIITIIKAFSNIEWEIPYLGKLARKQLAGEKLF